MIRSAVEQERVRVKYREAKEPETILGRDIKRRMDAPTGMIDRAVSRAAKKRLGQFKPKGKTN